MEIDLHTFFFQLSDSSEAVHGVTSEAADGFCDDEVDLPIKSILHHAVESVTVFGVGRRYAFVRIYGNKLPLGIRLDVLRVIIHLCLVACKLFLTISRYTGVPRNSPFVMNMGRYPCVPVQCGRDDRNILSHLICSSQVLSAERILSFPPSSFLPWNGLSIV